MGYTTDFSGSFQFNKKPDQKLIDYINTFTNTRHFTYDVEKIKAKIPFWRIFSLDENLGEKGEFIVDKNRILDVFQGPFTIDYNDSGNCPSLWAQWEIADDELVWDQGEKFYYYVDWLRFYIKNFFEPNGIVLNGVVYYYGEEYGDCGYIIADNNDVECFSTEEATLDDLLQKYANNKELVDTLKADGMTAERIESYYDDYDDYEVER